MSLVEAMMDDCTLLEKKRQDDGEGGWITTWEDGAKFRAAITLDTSMQARVAESQGVRSLFTVTTSKGIMLEFHDVIRNEKTGEYFRVTSEGKDKQSPHVASFDLAQVTAEKWNMPA